MAARVERNVSVAHRYPALNWRTSSASAGLTECVEVATSSSFVLARDSRDQSGPVLAFTPAQWAGLVQRVKAGQTVI